MTEYEKEILDRLNALMDAVWENPLMAQEYEHMD